jgi:F0F1-type ATP synthase assembly protein I
VAGTFAPDLTYYAASVLSGAMEFGDVTHSFPGVFTVDVLITWALVGLWLLVREPLVALLPRSRQRRTAALLRCGAPRARVRPRTVAWWYASAVLGALTHVVWDAFTHLDRWGMRLFPVLGQEFAGSPLYWYLQYGGSAVAAAVIAVFLVRALRRMPAAEPVGVPLLSPRDRWAAGLLLGGCALVAALHRAARWWAHWGSAAKPWELIPTLCFGAGAGMLLGVLLYAGAVRVWRPAPAPSRTSREPSRPAAR